MPKKIWKVARIVLLIFVGIIAAAVIILYTQQKRLTAFAISELNKQFKGELTVESSNIAPFQNFPNISIALHGIRFYDNKSQKGQPLYQVEHLYAGFSLPDIFRNQYNVRRLLLKGGYLTLVRERNGQLNIAEAKNIRADTTQTADTASAPLAIDLRKMVIRDLRISFLDRATGQLTASDIKKITASFHTDSARLAIALETDMMLDFTSPADTTFFRHKHMLLDIGADLDKQKQLLHIAKGAIRLQDADFVLTGTANVSSRPEVDFRIKGDKPDMNLIAAFIPGDVRESLRPFRYDGHLYFDATVKGPVSNNQQPLINVSFGCTEGWALNTGADRKVDSLRFAGTYTNGAERSLKTSELRITDMRARPGKGIFAGNFVLRDFTDPHVLMQLRSELDLQFIGEFLGIPDLRHISGKVKLNMDLRELYDLDLPEQSLHQLKKGVQSELTVEDLTFRIPGYPHPVRNLDLHAEMRDGRIVLDSLRMQVAESDLRLSGSLSDLLAVLHAHKKPVTVTLNASSRKIALRDLFAHDTAKANRITEEVNGFNIGISLATTVQELRSPKPLPRGEFELKQLRASFRKYPHAFHNIGATLRIGDTSLTLRNFAGMIDSSDFQFSGKVNNYQLWLQNIKKGKTMVAFDFKSSRLAMADLLGPVSRKFVPKDYQREIASRVWLRAKADLRYDTTFRFAKIRIANISGALQQHNMKLDSISGGLMYGNHILKADTLKGVIGRSDFDVNFRYYTGDKPELKQKTNYLYFKSKFLDIDQLGNYTAALTENHDTTAAVKAPVNNKTAVNAAHASAFNIFTIPFSSFDLQMDIGRLKYNRLWMKDVTARMRMQEDHYIHIDTLGMQVAGGAMGVRGYFNGSNPDKIFLRSRIRVQDVDLEKMMIKLDHFGQDLVINKNIKGRLTGLIRSHVQVHPNLVPLINDSKAELDVEIRNGSLVDFAPMQAMAGYFKDKNLRLVRFDTLRNVLTFTNGVLDIPTMNINSSLGFMEISGKQSMDMKMEYYMRIPMKMVTQVGFQALFGKKQAEVDLDQVDAIEYRDRNKKTRFMSLKVTGTPDNFKVGLGKAKGRS
ncbi:hypothetical protein ACWKWU_11100 [Chitinophaga lutea]